MLIAEHSMCQPGRPGPHGLSHAGSPGLALFHRAKSPGLRLLVADLDARAGFQLLRVAVAELAVIGVLADVEVDVAAGRVGVALVDQRLDHLDHLGDVVAWPAACDRCR